MKIRILLLLWCFTLITANSFAQYDFPACKPAWLSGTKYTKGDQVSHDGANYEYTATWESTSAPGLDNTWTKTSVCGNADQILGPGYKGKPRIVGYLPTWIPGYDISSFDPSVVSHINVSFLMMKQNNNDFTSENFASIDFNEADKQTMQDVFKNKKLVDRAHKTGTTVSIAIGGAADYAFLWLMDKYHNDDAKIEQIANLIVKYVNDNNLDGVDLDLECWWPDPSISGTTERARTRGDAWGSPDTEGPDPAGLGLTLLAKKLRAKMPSKFISAAVFGTANYGNNYDDKMVEYMDWLGLMTYDFTGSWDRSPIGPHSSLYKVTYAGSASEPVLSVQDALEYWMGTGKPAWNHNFPMHVPRAKLMTGVPVYGYDFRSKKPDGGNGYLFAPYKDIVNKYPNAATSYDPNDPNKLNGLIQEAGAWAGIHFETPKSAAAKVEYNKKSGHQGVIIWELTQDAPYNGGSSILKAINDAAGNANINPNTPPTVKIIKPSQGTEFTAGENITIEVDAKDEDGYIKKVEFFAGAEHIGTKTSSPYTVVWKAKEGPVAIKAIATDDKDASASHQININVKKNPSLGSVEISSPKDGQAFKSPADIKVEANAVAANGSTIKKIEFYVDNELKHTVTKEPFVYNWTKVHEETYYLKAKMYDSNNNTVESKVIKVVINKTGEELPDPGKPSVNLIIHGIGEGFTAPANIKMEAKPTIPNGTSFTKLEFYEGKKLLKSLKSAPFEHTWDNVEKGTYNITAKVYNDRHPEGVSSNTITVDVAKEEGTPNPDKPSVTIEIKDAEAGFTAPANIKMEAKVKIPQGAKLTKVVFYNGAKEIASLEKEPFTHLWENVPENVYSIYAKVYDDKHPEGISSRSLTVTVNKNHNNDENPDNEDQLPSVKIVSPKASDNFTSPADIRIEAMAESANGSSIKNVEIFIDDRLRETFETAPYVYKWNSVLKGTYTIKLEATDTKGRKTVQSVTVNVGGSSHICSGVPDYNHGQVYGKGEQVSYDGKVFESKYKHQGQLPTINSQAWTFIRNCDEVTEKPDSKEIIAKVFPNPLHAGEQLTLVMNLNQGENIEFMITDHMGRQWNAPEKIISRSTGVVQEIINVSHLPKGIYILRAQTKDGKRKKTTMFKKL